jgi:hypothetical protein
MFSVKPLTPSSSTMAISPGAGFLFMAPTSFRVTCIGYRNKTHAQINC